MTFLSVVATPVKVMSALAEVAPAASSEPALMA